MTRVDFYVSPGQTNQARWQVACRIAEKAYLQKHRIYIHTNNAEQTEQIDKMLWIFKAGSFIPHCQPHEAHHQQAAILIGHDSLPDMAPEVLINLADEVPTFFSRFERVAEVVAGDEQIRKTARNRFKYYRERGYPLETHQLNS